MTGEVEPHGPDERNNAIRPFAIGEGPLHVRLDHERSGLFRFRGFWKGFLVIDNTPAFALLVIPYVANWRDTYVPDPKWKLAPLLDNSAKHDTHTTTLNKGVLRFALPDGLPSMCAWIAACIADEKEYCVDFLPKAVLSYKSQPKPAENADSCPNP